MLSFSRVGNSRSDEELILDINKMLRQLDCCIGREQADYIHNSYSYLSDTHFGSSARPSRACPYSTVHMTDKFGSHMSQSDPVPPSLVLGSPEAGARKASPLCGSLSVKDNSIAARNVDKDRELAGQRCASQHRAFQDPILAIENKQCVNEKHTKASAVLSSYHTCPQMVY